MKKIIFLMLVSVLAMACGGAGTAGGGSAKMDVKIAGKDLAVPVKSGGIYKSVKTFTDKEGKATKALSYYAVMGNYEMDLSGPGWMKKPLTAADQTRVTVQLIGEEGTDQNSELKVGTYKADPSGKFMKIDALIVTTFADGKQEDTSFDAMFSGSKITGEVRVKTVTADEVSGEIDVTDGDKSIKGTFSAKAPPKK